MKYPEIKKIADDLRRNQTPSEKILWEKLRKQQLKGRKFLRQHVIIYESFKNNYYFFVPDFYCAREKLIIEVDGKIHDINKKKDKRRDQILVSKGLRILRIKNEELKDIDKVLERISSLFIVR